MAAQQAAGIEPAEARRVVFSSAVGTTIEFYDFALFGLVSVLVFGPQFFPGSDPVAGQLGALATLTIGYLMRPLGGVVAGHFGDRIGRKRVLVWSLMLMGGCTLAIAFLPTYRTAGLAAPVLLLVLRMVQGFAAGGEWGGAALMAVEHAPANKRGLYGSAPAVGTNLGSLIATVILLIVSATATDAFAGFGWRIAFGFSAVLIFVGFIVRRRVAESPLFEEAVRHEPPRIPFLQVVGKHPAALLRGVRWTVVTSAIGYTVSPFSVGYAVDKTGSSRETVLVCLAIGTIFMIGTVLLTARLLDRWRRPTLIVTALVQIPAAIVFFPLLSVGNLAATTLAYCLTYGAVGAINGTLGSVLADQFPVKIGYTGVSLCYNIAYAVGGTVPLVAGAIVAATGSVTWMVVILTVITLLALPVAFRRTPVDAD
jgi:MFS family permease